MSINSKDLDHIQKEHVTPIFYENPDNFNSLFVIPPKFYNISNLRITIDYKEDYQLLKKLFAIKNSISLEEVIEIFNQDASLFNLNKYCSQNKLRE